MSGHIYATNFQLGGRLTASKTADATDSVSDEAHRDAMKTSAAMSFSSAFVSGSNSGSNESETTNKGKKRRSGNDLMIKHAQPRHHRSLQCLHLPGTLAAATPFSLRGKFGL